MVLAALLCGCVSPRNQLVLAPVGPPPHSGESRSASGELIVFSALSAAPNFQSSPYHRTYTDYRVLSADGSEVVKEVHNDTGKLLEGPSRVELPVGRYQVLARANGYGNVTVPVVIKPHQVTTLHLEGSAWWSKSSGIFDSNPVRLPNGEIVGWRAELSQGP